MHFIFIKQVSYTLFRPTISQPSNPFQLITSMNPIFFSCQVLSLNSSPFSSSRISLSKKIGADWSLSLSRLVETRESERKEKAYCRGKRRKRDLTLTCLNKRALVWRELVFFWKIIAKNKPKKTRVIIIWLFHWPTWVFLWPTFSYAIIQKCFFAQANAALEIFWFPINLFENPPLFSIEHSVKTLNS